MIRVPIPALVGVDRIYLVTPYLGSGDFAGRVSRFLDMAGERAVRHVTYLSAHGIDRAPPEVPFRAVELDLLGREAFTHSILRPAWFNQNFSEAFLRPVDDVIALPVGNGLEAFVDVEDVAAREFGTWWVHSIPNTDTGIGRDSNSTDNNSRHFDLGNLASFVRLSYARMRDLEIL